MPFDENESLANLPSERYFNLSFTSELGSTAIGSDDFFTVRIGELESRVSEARYLFNPDQTMTLQQLTLHAAELTMRASLAAKRFAVEIIDNLETSEVDTIEVVRKNIGDEIVHYMKLPLFAKPPQRDLLS
jgi:polyphosphate kinase